MLESLWLKHNKGLKCECEINMFFKRIHAFFGRTFCCVHSIAHKNYIHSWYIEIRIDRKQPSQETGISRVTGMLASPYQ